MESVADYKKAEAAVRKILQDEKKNMYNDMDGDDYDEAAEDAALQNKVWLQSPHSRSFVLVQLQKAFCTR